MGWDKTALSEKRGFSKPGFNRMPQNAGNRQLPSAEYLNLHGGEKEVIWGRRYCKQRGRRYYEVADIGGDGLSGELVDNWFASTPVLLVN